MAHMLPGFRPNSLARGGRRACTDRLPLAGAAALLVCAMTATTPAQSLTPSQQLARDIYKELVEIDTVTETGDTGHAADAMAARLRTAGFEGADLQVFKPASLKRVVADDQISITPIGRPVQSPPSPLDERLLSVLERTSAEFWPGVPVVPVMSAGGTDGIFLRNAGIPTYGHSGLAGDVDDDRMHGKDERIAVKAFFDGGEYLYRLVKRLSGGQ